VTSEGTGGLRDLEIKLYSSVTSINVKAQCVPDGSFLYKFYFQAVPVVNLFSALC
jgi:hypothetical protein